MGRLFIHPSGSYCLFNCAFLPTRIVQNEKILIEEVKTEITTSKNKHVFVFCVCLVDHIK